MAPAATAQQPDGAVATMPEPDVFTPKRETTWSSDSDDVLWQRPLPKQMTYKSRRKLIDKTERLIKERNELDSVFLRKVDDQRNQTGLEPGKALSRYDVLKENKRLARREALHIRVENRRIREHKRLLEIDPCLEHRNDIKLLETLQSKFKRNLGVYLSDREPPVKRYEVDSDTSSDASHRSGDEDGQDEVASQPDADLSSSSGPADPDQDSSHLDSTAGASKQSTSSLDGSFDDYARDSKRQRVAGGSSSLKTREEQRAQAKKEQTANNQDQATTSRSPSSRHNDCIECLEDEEAGYAGDLAALESMSQSNDQPNKKLKVYGKKAHTKTPAPDVNGIAAVSTPSTNAASVNINGAKTKATNTQALRSATQKPEAPTKPLVEPSYKRFARAMMDPDFDDWVYDRPTRKRKRTRSDEVVRGALPDPRHVGSGDVSLPTPPTSSPAPSSSASMQSEPKKGDKSQGGAKFRKNTTRRGKARNRSRLAGPESLDSGCSASGPYDSSRKGMRKAQQGPSNTVSAS